MINIPSKTTTVSIVNSTFLHLGALSFGVFVAVMGFLWRPGRGTTEEEEEEEEEIFRNIYRDETQGSHFNRI